MNGMTFLFRVIVLGLLATSALAAGASFTAVTVISTVAGLLVNAPSLTVNVKLSDPLKFVFGV